MPALQRAFRPERLRAARRRERSTPSSSSKRTARTGESLREVRVGRGARRARAADRRHRRVRRSARRVARAIGALAHISGSPPRRRRSTQHPGTPHGLLLSAGVRARRAGGRASSGCRSICASPPTSSPTRSRSCERCPETRFVLDHCGKPAIRDDAFERVGASDSARSPLHERVVCKISGLLTEARPDQRDAASLRPYVEHAMACFGAARLMYGSDWPVVDARVAAQSAGARSWTSSSAEWRRAERQALLAENAVRFYDLEVPVHALTHRRRTARWPHGDRHRRRLGDRTGHRAALRARAARASASLDVAPADETLERHPCRRRHRPTRIACDVSRQHDGDARVRRGRGAFGPLDILVNSAGVAHVGTVETTTEDDLDRIYAVNVKGVYNCLKRRRRGDEGSRRRDPQHRVRRRRPSASPIASPTR